MPMYDRQTQKATADMYIKDRFINSGKNLQIVADRIIENDVLVKLLTRNGKGALDDGAPVTDAERADAMTKNITTIPVIDKDIDINTLISVQIADIVPINQGLTYSLVFDILCNVEVWNLDGYIQRPYAIMNELDQLFANTKMKSMGPATFLGATSLKINERMLGYTMMFSFAEVQ